MKQLALLYAKHIGIYPDSISPLTPSGSHRLYYRLSAPNSPSLIGVIGTSADENNAFIYLAKHFRSKNLPVPDILAISPDHLRYLQTDLGSISLFDALNDGRINGFGPRQLDLLLKTIRLLPKIQVIGAQDLDFSKCWPISVFDQQSILFDLNYFKYCFLLPSGLSFNERLLDKDFHNLADSLLAEPFNSFMYRDFQARNIMIDPDGNPWLIDFQGGRKGPFYYDLASFLWQASGKYPNKLRRLLVREYYDALSQLTNVPSTRQFVDRLCQFVLFRMLQVLGAYGFRGLYERKHHFLDSIPPALYNLNQLLKLNRFPYPHLTDLLSQLACQPTSDSHPDNSKLTVRILSFAYKNGIPHDPSGNGGGYVFDCRAIPNPGKLEAYKHMTGLDQPVKLFLENNGEILNFLDRIYDLTDHHVTRFIERGFSNLMIAFGCTGGQHRSVYCAERLSEHIKLKFGINVITFHRELNLYSK